MIEVCRASYRFERGDHGQARGADGRQKAADQPNDHRKQKAFGDEQWCNPEFKYLFTEVIKAQCAGGEKLVDPNELVTPQSFGGTRGPSTALISLADLKDLQVEIDLNEQYVGRVEVGQKCRVTPEAYPDKSYEGYVAEKAPEANRQKGTLQVKVQIKNPDKFLTPELSAKVDFLKIDSAVPVAKSS